SGTGEGKREASARCDETVLQTANESTPRKKRELLSGTNLLASPQRQQGSVPCWRCGLAKIPLLALRAGQNVRTSYHPSAITSTPHKIVRGDEQDGSGVSLMVRSRRTRIS